MLSETHKAALRYAENEANLDVFFLCADGESVGGLTQLVCMRSAYFEDLIKNQLSTSASHSTNGSSKVAAPVVKLPVSSKVMKAILYYLYTDTLQVSSDEETTRLLIQVIAASLRFTLKPLADKVEHHLFHDDKISPCIVLSEIEKLGGPHLTRLKQKALKKIKGNAEFWLLPTDSNAAPAPGILYLSQDQLVGLLKHLKPHVQFRCLESWINSSTGNEASEEAQENRLEHMKGVLAGLNYAEMDPVFVHDTVRTSGLVPLDTLYDALYLQLPAIRKKKRKVKELPKEEKKDGKSDSSDVKRGKIQANKVVSADKNGQEEVESFGSGTKEKNAGIVSMTAAVPCVTPKKGEGEPASCTTGAGLEALAALCGNATKATAAENEEK